MSKVEEMEVSDKCFSSSTLKKSLMPVKSENDQNYPEMGFDSQNLKKHTARSFMSSTISATSKALPPRKRVLTERNESSTPKFSDPSSQNTSNIDPKTTKKTTTKAASLDFAFDDTESSLSKSTPLPSQGVEIDENEREVLVDDLSVRPYDPLTNYVSPRPRFLRYKPNRRRDILLRSVSDVREATDGSSIGTSASSEAKSDACEEADLVTCDNSLASLLKEGASKQDDEETDESDEEFEEVEDKRGWSWKGVLEFLILFFVLVVSTLYISSMNSPEPSLALEAFEDLKDGYQKIHNHVNEFVKSLEGRYLFLDELESTKMGIAVVNQTIIKKGIEGEKVVEAVDKLSEAAEVRGRKDEPLEITAAEKREIVEKLGEIEIEGRRSEDVCQDKAAKTGEVFIQMVQVVELQASQTTQQFASTEDDQRRVLSAGLDDEVQIPDIIANAMEKGKEVALEPVEVVQTEEARGEEREESETGIFANITKMDSGVTMRETIDKVHAEFKLVKKEADQETTKGGLVHLMGSEFALEAIIGVSVSAVLFSLMWGFFLKRRSNVTKESSMVSGPCSEPAVAEKCSSVLPNEKEERREHLDSFIDAISSTNSEDSKELLQSQPPSVQFLGEFVVGGISSSFRSFGVKSKIDDDEVSSHSVSVGKGSRSKPHSVPVYTQLSISECSTMGSTTYGSFTSEKSLAKEKREDTEAKDVVTTPVRRSSRIRNRRITSP